MHESDVLFRCCIKELAAGGAVLTLPHFLGRRAPLWDPYARGALFGLHPVDMELLARANGLILVNTSRAALISREALENALIEGRVSFFGSDVFWKEPPIYSDPRTVRFLKRRDVLATPHMAWYSGDSERELRRKAAEEILQVLRGEQPLHGLQPA